MVTNCVPVLADFFFIYHHEAEYMQKTKELQIKLKSSWGNLKHFVNSVSALVVILVTNTPFFWLSNLWILSVPGEYYSRNTPKALTLIYTRNIIGLK
jgi:hypothetical protein